MPQPLSNALIGVPAKCRSYLFGGSLSQVEFLVPLAEVRTHLRPVFRPYLHSDRQLRTAGLSLASLMEF